MHWTSDGKTKKKKKIILNGLNQEDEEEEEENFKLIHIMRGKIDPFVERRGTFLMCVYAINNAAHNSID